MISLPIYSPIGSLNSRIGNVIIKKYRKTEWQGFCLQRQNTPAVLRISDISICQHSDYCTDLIETSTSPPPPPGKPRAFELLKIGSFIVQIPAPLGQNVVQMPYPIVAFCLSNTPPKEQSSSVLDVCNKAGVYSRYAKTSIQEGKLF